MPFSIEGGIAGWAEGLTYKYSFLVPYALQQERKHHICTLHSLTVMCGLVKLMERSGLNCKCMLIIPREGQGWKQIAG